MGDAPLSSLVLTMKSVFYPDKHIISSLQDKVNYLAALLENSSVSGSLRIKNLEEHIRNAAREAEQLIKFHDSSRKRFEKLINSFCGSAEWVPPESQDWNKIMDTFDEISEAVSNIKEGKVEDLQPKSTWIVRSTIFSESGKSSMAVVDQDCKQIINHVIGSSRALSIITFYGMEGVGISILAKKVYWHSVIQKRFKILAWITVPRNYDGREKIIMDLLDSMRVKVEPRDQSFDQLSHILYKSLQGRRYLIVMDDVRDTRACDDIQRLIPKNNNGSRIILTTKLFEVAAQDNLEGGVRRTRRLTTMIHLMPSAKKASIEEIVADPPESYDPGQKQVEPFGEGASQKWDEGVRTAAEEGSAEEISIEEMPKEDMFLKYCSAFPTGYEFTKNTIVWLLMAQGWIKVVSDEDEDEDEEEEEWIKCFDKLLNSKNIVPARYDHYCDQMKYKIGEKKNAFPQKQLVGFQSAKELDSEQIDVGKLIYLLLAFKASDHINFNILKKCSRLQTLIIHGCNGSKVKKLPSDLFLELKDLKVLCLSHNNLEELPSSIESSKGLRYLDMSETPIKWLPESIHCLTNLQTLRLDGCLRLIGLPKSMNQLINLRHLILDVARQLQSMPTGIGKLSKLHTLSSFLVGRDDGCRISELKNMNKLKGSLRILKLENVLEVVEAVEASLYNKLNLKRIELQWSDLQVEKNTNEEEILEFLLPPWGVQELEILYYSGGALPSWISFPSFSEMVSLTLYKCRYCDSLPSLGELPSLKFLSIIGMNQVSEINSLFCRKHAKPSFLDKLSFDSMPYLKKLAGTEIKNVFNFKEANQNQPAFPKLEKLSFDSMSGLIKWRGVESGDFPSLTHLIIEYCPKFIGLPSLSHLNSLVHMEINYCPELASLPNGGLPSTLESLMIKDCPKLKDRCCKDKGKDWSKVARVPSFYMDNQKVSEL